VHAIEANDGNYSGDGQYYISYLDHGLKLRGLTADEVMISASAPRPL
jgi:hypothetical protein